jgi:hypothetical protein
MAKTIESQTGWKRTFPKMLCQDIKVLEKVKHYTFDINNRTFTEHFVARTGVDILHPDVKIDLVLISDDRHCKIVRGQLQDCWELFTGAQNG